MSRGLWIKMRRSISSDPDVIRIAELTDLDRFAVVGRLHAVWAWADEHEVAKRDGVTVTVKFIDRVIEHDGFANAMREVGWLDGEDGALVLPNFDRHNGPDAKNKAQNARRNRQFRSRTQSQSDQSADEKRDASTVTQPSPKTRQDKTRLRRRGGNRTLSDCRRRDVEIEDGRPRLEASQQEADS